MREAVDEIDIQIIKPTNKKNRKITLLALEKIRRILDGTLNGVVEFTEEKEEKQPFRRGCFFTFTNES